MLEIRRSRHLVFVCVFAVLPAVPFAADAGILTSGGILTYEQRASDRWLRRYSFDGQLTDELAVNLDSLPAEMAGVWAMTVVGSRVIVAENPLWGRSIGEINPATGNVSYLFDHQGFIGSAVPRLDARGSELLIHSIGSGSGTTQAYNLQGDFLRPYFIPVDLYGAYLQAEGMAYANGEIYYSRNYSQPPSNIIGVFDITGSPVMSLTREIALTRTGVGEISVDAASGDIWTAPGGGLARYSASGVEMDSFSTVNGLRDFYVLSATAVPEPSSFYLLATAGLISFACFRRRQTTRTGSQRLAGE